MIQKEKIDIFNNYVPLTEVNKEKCTPINWSLGESIPIEAAVQIVELCGGRRLFEKKNRAIDIINLCVIPTLGSEADIDYWRQIAIDIESKLEPII
jgi:hypothetical protein